MASVVANVVLYCTDLVLFETCIGRLVIDNIAMMRPYERFINHQW